MIVAPATKLEFVGGPLLLSPPTCSNYQIAMGHTDFFAQPNQLWDQNC